MESIQQQITTLTQKVDRIYQVVDRLHDQISPNLDPQIRRAPASSHHSRRSNTEHPLTRDDLHRLRQNGSKDRQIHSADLPSDSSDRQDPTEWSVTPPDVLIDSSGVEICYHQIKEQDLSPQIQIQRLTAQLTAAYNQIAALEEQLLANRWR